MLKAIGTQAMVRFVLLAIPTREKPGSVSVDIVTGKNKIKVSEKK